MADLQKIPLKIREQMMGIAEIRKQIIEQRTLDLFYNLKSIQQRLALGNMPSLELQDVELNREKNMLKLGDKVRKLVEQESKFKAQLNLKQIKKLQESKDDVI